MDESSSSVIDGRPAKRARSEEDISVPSEGYVRDQEFWLADGSLILDVQGTAFRVYKGLLSEQSPILRNLLSSTHLSPDASCDGVPVVTLKDSAHDWRHLLRILLPKSSIRSTFKLQDFPMLSALLRLSHMYEMANVMEFAIAGLKTVYSDNYNAWITIDRSVCGIWARPGERKILERGNIATKRSRLLSQAIVAINFARILNIPSVLPAAFYHCACLGGAVLKGYTHDDGTTEYLSEDDTQRCIDGIQDLTAAAADYVAPLRDSQPEHHGCQKGGACRRIWKDSVVDRLREDWRAVLGNLALRGVLEMFPLNALCDTCKRWAEGRVEARRKVVWQELPKTFDIGDVVGSWPKC
ncbi:hypothetical protein C8T65DRAFT_607848 [Cerioporus squamosus]|nr:hypothetical protein C8T65DRAFT_607848 [Cerioporus squamosus]